MTSAWLPPFAAVLVLLASAAPVHALSLLDQRSDEEGLQLRVRSAGPLQVSALAGNLTLDGTSLEEARTLEAEGGTWRGFENVTRLHVDGTGLLLVAHGGTGLIFPVDPPPDGDDGSRPDGPAPGEDRGQGPSEDTNRSVPGSTTAAPGEDDGRPGPRTAGGQAPSSQPKEADDEGDRGPSIPRHPVAIGLALLAIGAFLVERWTRTTDAGLSDPAKRRP